MESREACANLLAACATRFCDAGLEVLRGTTGITIKRVGLPDVTATAAEADGKRAIVLLTTVCAEHVVDPRSVLEAVAYMGAGAIALVGGSYVVRFTVPEGAVESGPLVEAVRFSGEVAKELRAYLCGDGRNERASGVFGHYVG